MNRLFDDYIQKVIMIRELSMPHLEEIDSPERYGEILRENFRKIGRLSRENREQISDELIPMLQDAETLTQEELDQLIGFSMSLINSRHLDTLDPAIGWYIAESLYHSVYENVPLKEQLKILEIYLAACYNMCLKTRRIEAVSDLCDQFRRKGLDAFFLFESYLPKEVFREIPDEESRIRILRNVRYGHCLYEGERSSEESRRKEIEGLEELLLLSGDEEIRRLVPSFDWDHHRFRVLEYLALSVDYNNIRGFTREEAQRLLSYAEECSAIWKSDPEYYSRKAPGGRVFLAWLSSAYFAGEMDLDTYQDRLIGFYRDNLPKDDYERESIYGIFHAALAYIMSLEGTALREKDEEALTMFYEGIMECAINSGDAAEESYILEMIALILEHFIEVPDVSFERLSLTCMAALHTPTYIHTLSVSYLARCITREACERMPEVFAGFPGCGSAEDVVRKKKEILDFAAHASLVHDVGKLSIIDTIFIYERNLLKFEFNRLIRLHSRMGAYLLEKNESTRKYAPVAIGHHQWYDGSRGYPGEPDMRGDPLKPLIDIVECADCMDAATDLIGRSYHPGKSLDRFLEEVRSGAGTRYAPWLPELLETPEVYRELNGILTERRDRNYRDTCRILKLSRLRRSGEEFSSKILARNYDEIFHPEDHEKS